MKTTLLLAALLLSSCVTLPPNAAITVPIGDPPIGSASIERVDDPAPGTRLSFETAEENIGTDQVRFEFNEREAAVIIYDEPLPISAEELMTK